MGACGVKSPRGWWAVDQALGQTPCLCGAIDTWHPGCYAGKTNEQVEAGYVTAYAMARKALRERCTEKTASVISKARRAEPEP